MVDKIKDFYLNFVSGRVFNRMLNSDLILFATKLYRNVAYCSNFDYIYLALECLNAPSGSKPSHRMTNPDHAGIPNLVEW